MTTFDDKTGASEAEFQARTQPFGIFEEEERAANDAWLVLSALPISIPGYSPETVAKAHTHLTAALADAERRGREQGDALRARVADVADELADYAVETGGAAGVGLRVAADRIRAALDPQTGAVTSEARL